MNLISGTYLYQFLNNIDKSLNQGFAAGGLQLAGYLHTIVVENIYILTL